MIKPIRVEDEAAERVLTELSDEELKRRYGILYRRVNLLLGELKRRGLEEFVEYG